MKVIKTDIIPEKQIFVKIRNEQHDLDFKAICIFSALGFFLDDDTYWLDTKVLKPATINTIDNDGFLVSSEKWFSWYYTPRDISLDQAVIEFSEIFEKNIENETKGKKVILPLSGGLDSRTQAIALNKINANVKSYSYSFENGFKEAEISRKIANTLNFPFQDFEIKNGYLWNKIEDLATINECYSEFTHPRQMAVIDEVKKLGDIFSLGHWGDVLFDSEGIDYVDEFKILPILKKKMVKKGGLELAESLWKGWKLEGEFKEYLDKRLLNLWNDIDIDNFSAKIRAFKSLYWAPRWTSVNLSIFENEKPLNLPYYDNEMCKFICTLPESLLKDRQIQIEYIKQNSVEVAKITWQAKGAFNLYNYHLNKFPYNLPYRIISKIKRTLKEVFGEKYIQRNWELQFLGEKNEEKLKYYLFSNEYSTFISSKTIKSFYNSFKTKNSVTYSHSISILLTLSLWFKNYRK